MKPFWHSMIVSLITAIITFIISTAFYLKHETKQMKLDVFRTLVGSRYVLTAKPGSPDANTEFFRALNEAFVVFHDSKKVLAVLEEFHRNPGNTSANLVDLFKAMSDDLGIEGITDVQYLTKPLVPNIQN